MVTSKYIFELYKGRGGGIRIRVIHRNGNIVFNAGQAYSRRIGAEKMLTNFIAAVQAGNYDNLDAIPSARRQAKKGEDKVAQETH